ncbi:MAG: hypothetical protein JEY91_03695 [Spirochaetaceae bacterium]|nr:hypothetical protein [Spirochaetaceae bacterium]
MITLDSEKLGSALIINGIVFSIIIFLWPITMVLAPGAEGSISEQLREIALHPVSYQLSFILASVIGPSILSLMLIYSMFIETKKTTVIFSLMGIIFMIPYVVFVTISYTSQYIYFINLLNSDVNSAAQWYFGNFNSLPYYLNQLGYTFFALGGIFIGYRYCFDRGIKKAFGIILEICSLLSIIAFIGLALGNKFLNTATLISGLLTLPFGIFAIIIGMKIKKAH